MPFYFDVRWKLRNPRSHKAHRRSCERAAGDGYREGGWLFRQDKLPWECWSRPRDELNHREAEVWRHYEQNILQGFLDAAELAKMTEPVDVLLDKE